jgi:hypothetical protein
VPSVAMVLTALRFDFSQYKFINLLRTSSSDMRICGKGVLQTSDHCLSPHG